MYLPQHKIYIQLNHGVVLNGFSFRSSVAVHADDFETLVSSKRHVKDCQGAG
jgi:hypothetical protein